MLKVLITGKNRKVAGDVAEHLETDRGYITVKCNPVKTALFDLVLAELPKVVIICLGDETEETIQAYDVIKTAVNQGGCTVIVITNDEDGEFFMKYTGISRALFLSRPVSLFALYEKLSQVEAELEESKKEGLSQFREFRNEKAEPGRRRILVVDDDTEQLVHIKEQLEEFYDVTPVKSGDATFKYLMKHKPDLILLDYLMPGRDGPQILRELRAIDEYADIPVVFLTGMSERETVVKTLTELRPEGYIVKPSKKSEIVAKIIDVIG